jgi:hypothetical protein
MKKLLLIAGMFCSAQLINAQYYNIPFANAGQNPGGVNPDGENPYPSANNTGWTNLWNGDATATTSYLAEQSIPFAFKFNGASVTKYTPSNFGTVSFDAGTPTVKPSAFSNVTLPSAQIPDNSVCALGIKPISAVSGTTTYKSAVMTKTYGTAGKRQHWIWFNFFGEANINSGWTYWGIVLEETTNNIYIVDMKTLCVTTAGALCTNNVKMSLGIQTSSTTAYSVAGSPNVGAKQITQNVFTAADNSYYQFIQGNQPTNDVRGVKVSMSPYQMMTSPITITANFMNYGSAAVKSCDLNYSVDGGSVVTAAASSVNIASLASADMSHTTKWSPSAVGKYTIKVWASNINGNADENLTNDTAVLQINVLDKFAPRKILNEIFTSSTCGPCVPGNANYIKVTTGKTQHSTIKYQVYFPGTGDPYCTQEVRDRASYYMPTNLSVPRMEIDGGWDGNASSFTAALYDQFSAKPSFIEITGSIGLTWKNKITADITLNPLADNGSGNLKLFAVITEGTTFWNKKTNGETQFENVMKKMMPNSSGMAISALTKGQGVNKSMSFSFAGNYRLPKDGSVAQHINNATENSVESWDDLEVVVFVQDATTKEVLQSETFPITLTGVEALEQGIQLFPNPANDMFNLRVAGLASEKAVVIVTNVKGQVVYTGTMLDGKSQINVSNLSEGMYVVSVNSGTKNLNTKMVVRH